MSMTKDEINVDLFDEVKRLKAENRALKKELDTTGIGHVGSCNQNFGTLNIVIATPSGREVSLAFYQPPMDKLFKIVEGKQYSVNITPLN